MSATPGSIPFTAGRRWLARAAALLAAGTVVLIGYGGLVHSAGAGLSVPDWPTTYGENMFTFPIEKWTGGIVYEHGHRLLASGIGALTILVAALVYFVDHRRWMKVLATGALLAVVIQGVLGGLTVLMQLPTAVSVSHAMLAQLFMIMAMAIAAASTRAWVTGPPISDIPVGDGVRRLFLVTSVAALIQIFLGAVTRHTYSGMAIQDFPLSNGALIPAFTSFGVAIQFAHRSGAVVLAALIVVSAIAVRRNAALAGLRPLSAMLAAMVAVQILLGATVIWTREAIIPNTLHVAGGALTFALAFLTWFQARRRYRFRSAEAHPVVRVEGAGAR